MTNAAFGQFVSEAVGLASEAFVRPAHSAQAAMMHEHRVAPAALEIVKITQ